MNDTWKPLGAAVSDVLKKIGSHQPKPQNKPSESRENAA